MCANDHVPGRFSYRLILMSLLCLAGEPAGAGTFFDNFEDDDAEGWTVVEETFSQWSVDDGGYYGELFTGAEGVTLIGEPDWQVDSIEATFRDFQADWIALVWRWQDVNNFESWWVNGPAAVLEAWPKVGTYEAAPRVAAPVPLQPGGEHTLKVAIDGDTFAAYFDDVFVGEYTSDAFTSGPVGLLIWNGSVTFDDVKITGPNVGGLTGDFNGDGALDAADIDDLTGQSASGMHRVAYDLNTDSLVNDADIGIWIKDLFRSWVGDADLNGQFNSGDLVAVLASGTYEADVDAVWSTGDFNGDGRTNSGDLVAALADGGYEAGPRAAISSVPEPSCGVFCFVALAFLHARSRATPCRRTAQSPDRS